MLKIPFFLLFLFFVIVWIQYRRVRFNGNSVRETFMTVFFCYLMMVFYVTFMPFHFAFFSPDAIPIQGIPFAGIVAEYHRNHHIAILYTLGNIILFMPFGFFMTLFIRSRHVFIRIFFYSLLFSCSIECCQHVFTMDRTADIDDVLFNVIGGLLGYRVFYLVDKILEQFN